MTWLNSHPLTFLVFAPTLLGFVLMALPHSLGKLARLLGFLGALGVFILSLAWLLGHGSAGAVLVERAPWFTLVNLPVDYALTVDGLNLWLVILTTFLVPLTMLGTWNSLKDRIGTFAALFLLLETGMLGALMAQDLFFFYLFWEAMLIPMYFMIGVWGGDERRYAANKFFLYTLSGSLLWLVALLYLANKAGGFNPAVMAQAASALPFGVQCWLFVAFAVAFAIKVPLFPLHTWLPDAHVQAPTAGSVILAGVLLKLGGYGFIRFAIPMFPQAAMHYAQPIALLSVVAIVYGALVAMVQRDIKKLVAYSSVSHMGFVMLGLASMTVIGTQGAMLQMLNHGISTGALFLLVGMLYDRAHTRMIADFGGVVTKMPVFTTFFMIVTLSSIGLPLTNGFVGEFWILNGTFLSGFGWGRLYACLATSGVLLGAVYMLWMFMRVFWGPENKDEDSGTHHLHSDLNAREIAVMLPLVVLIVWMGVHPKTFMVASEAPVASLLQDIKAPAPRTFVLRPAVHEAPAPAGAQAHEASAAPEPSAAHEVH
ncbi:NADH:ubiquinone oxidoreductase subunit M [Geothrix oryzae]|uniref:NADH:ubiquinone oxidoreductase subunit M n=1 Tax=Geothrix oryzae TaxID=2927975 RepID=A0ABN6UVW0_9BACT|nr:NADH-quinone oxidoreductase subunit M [Geothrix oryzae]BDU68359.1 NADH:ubiquinone oxidoreductase subunit M [Geothrix oryzae]